MYKLWIVARREYLVSVRTKGFLIGLVLLPLLMSGGFIAIYALRNQVDTKDKRLVILDHTGRVADSLLASAEERNAKEVYDAKTKKKIRPAYLLEKLNPDAENPDRQRLALSDRVRKGELHAFLEIGSDVLHPKEKSAEAAIAYHGKNPGLDDMRRWLGNPINDQLRRLRLAEAGIDSSRIQDLFLWRPIDGMGLLSRDPKDGSIQKAERRGELEAIGVPMAVMFLSFMLLMMGASPLLNAVMEEKNQRIAEVVLGSVKPFPWMMGKVLGAVGISLTGLTVYLVLGIMAVGNMPITWSIPYFLIPWLFLFLVLNICMYGSIMAALGSLCTDIKDAQNLTFPALLPAMIPMFIWFPVAQQPLSTFSTVASLIPLFTPILMPLRMATQESIPLWQPWLGLLGVILATIACVWVGGRIFRFGIVAQGKIPSFSEIVRWVSRG